MKFILKLIWQFFLFICKNTVIVFVIVFLVIPVGIVINVIGILYRGLIDLHEWCMEMEDILIDEFFRGIH